MAVAARKLEDLRSPAQPGERLELAGVMERVKVSLNDLAEALGISRTAVFSIVTNNI